jgi:hydroxylamine reductase
MDLLIYLLKGVSIFAQKADDADVMAAGDFITKALFATITNANFDDERITKLIKEALDARNNLRSKYGSKITGPLHDCATWYSNDPAAFAEKAKEVGVLATANEDVRSLRQLLILGLKGISAYSHHAAVLGYEDKEIYSFIITALVSTVQDLSVEEMVGYVLKAGTCAANTMALLDKANTGTYGNPEITKVDIGVRNNPGILISGHDLKDLEELFEQTQGTGVDIYTHSEMLPAHYYPKFKKYSNFAGNYGGSWWKQDTEFDSFNGPILMTTNCIVPVKDSYRNRIFTTGMAGYPGIKHIADRAKGTKKDFSEIITLAKSCKSPTEIEKGQIVGGFAHNQVLALADKVVDAVKSGAIKRFVVMAGCDGRHKTRNYFTEVAENLPKDTIILTAGCAKYRYIKLNLGDIGGIPRVLDAGQCNDSYSLAVIALKLKEVFGLDDVNKLPLSFDIGWYEQKAVAVLLAILALGFKNIRLGPTLPAFLSPAVAKVLVETFDIKLVTEPKADIEAMMAGK